MVIRMWWIWFIGICCSNWEFQTCIIIYEVNIGKVGSINKEVEKIENKFDDNHAQQSFAKNVTNN